jgi:hypothetical protein
MGSDPPESRNEIPTQKFENQAAPAARINNSDNLDFRTVRESFTAAMVWA